MFKTQKLFQMCTIILTVAATTPLKADIEATTTDGRAVVLFDDFTWNYRSASNPSPSSGPMVQDNWNPSACGLTGSATVRIPVGGAQVKRIVTWYNWEGSQQSASAGFYSSNGSTVVSGQIARGSCDPYQTSWCEGLLDIGRALTGGKYILQVMPPRICQNAGSGGEGFVRVMGRAGGGGVVTPTPPRPQPVIPAPPTPPNTPIAGVWDTSEGDWNASVDGSGAIGGPYETDNGYITGRLDGLRMTGYWREDDSALRCSYARNGEYHWGNFSFTFNRDMTSFTGAYGHCDETPDHNWSGKRK